MRVALVYDRVNKWGGAERVLLSLKKLFPRAPLYTVVYNSKTAPWAKDFQVIPSFLQKFPLARGRHEFYPWLTPLAFESFDFDQFEIVISVTSAEAKGIITKPQTLHLCYCLTPTRYLWSGRLGYSQSPGFGALDFLARTSLRILIPYLTKWDKAASQRPDFYLATCLNVKKRIKKYYQRDAEVIYPPVDLEKFKINPPAGGEKLKIADQNSKFFLIVSRLVPYKRVDLAVEAFNQLGLSLKIVGVGSELNRLKKKAYANIEFLGQLTDRELLRYYCSCQAVICPQEEDFGLVPLEAQACGKPVVSFKGGGALETIIEGKTGEFFYPQTPQALFKLFKRFRPQKYEPRACRKNAGKFDQKVFIKKFKKEVERKWKKHRKTSTL